MSCVVGGVVTPAVAIETPYGWAMDDPAKFIDETDPNWCEQCHPDEFEVWKETKHAEGFKAMRQSDKAREIADRLGITSVTRDSRCLTCHFTVKERRGKQTAVSGVSCQSCHGAARDWVAVHHDHGIGFDHFSETPAHKRERLEKVRAAGMRRPSDLYPSAMSCYRCHLVPDEKLVNEGGHRPGTSNFELVSRTQEKIRHNFLATRLREEPPHNATRSQAHKRRMYVMGRALELEFSLRGLAVATTEGLYLDKMRTRVQDAIAHLQDIQLVSPVPEVKRMLALVEGVELEPNRKAVLERLAEEVGKLNRKLVQQHDGTRWAALDPLVSGEGVPPELLPEPAFSPPPDGASPAPSGGGATPAAAGGAAQAAYARKRHIREIANWGFLGAGECAGCHDDSWDWYGDHAHAKAVEPFRGQEADVLRIARNYGINASQVASGASVCMDCHSTVPRSSQGRANRSMRKGVDCQGCHGAADRYLEPHKEEEGTGKAYEVGLRNGMVDVRDLTSTARNCTSCHYITDQRLLASGHGSGKDFDFVTGMKSVKHWTRALPSASQIQQAFGAAIAKRGGVPQVEAIQAPVSIPSAPVRTAAAGSSGSSRSSAGGNVPAPRPAARVARTELRIDLPDFPELPEDAPVEERLRLIQQRLELLREQLASGGGR